MPPDSYSYKDNNYQGKSWKTIYYPYLKLKTNRVTETALKQGLQQML